MRRLTPRALLTVFVAFLNISIADAQDRSAFARKVCTVAETEANKVGIDANFLVRLLWKESMFDPNAVSPKGAEGIAQFMPDTAKRVGLADPFEPVAAVGASASFLAGLKKQFGNLGLAAAAYNAGEARVERWKNNQSGMPYETQDYVAFITGKDVEAWRDAAAAHPIPAVGKTGTVTENCIKLALRVSFPQGTTRANRTSAPLKPWGAMLASHFQEGMALSMFQRLKVRFPQQLAGQQPMVVKKKNLSRGSRAMAMVMLGANSQSEAQSLCRSLSAAGAPCVVRKVR